MGTLLKLVVYVVAGVAVAGGGFYALYRIGYAVARMALKDDEPDEVAAIAAATLVIVAVVFGGMVGWLILGEYGLGWL